MKCKVASPCKECPFLKTSVKGWLGPDTAEEVLQQVHGDYGYVCHTSIEGKADEDTGRVDTSKHGHQCIGATIHANMSCKLYSNPDLRDLQIKLKGFEKKYGILDYPQFLEHHKHSFVTQVKGKTRGNKKQRV